MGTHPIRIKIHHTGSQYSYTDIIVVPKAGIRISFADDNTGTADTGFASNAAYVVSFWELSGGEYVIDGEFPGYVGNGKNPTAVSALQSDGSVLYSYVTSQDNECIRLCFRSGQTTSITPAQYPIVTAA